MADRPGPIPLAQSNVLSGIKRLVRATKRRGGQWAQSGRKVVVRQDHIALLDVRAFHQPADLARDRAVPAERAGSKNDEPRNTSKTDCLVRSTGIKVRSLAHNSLILVKGSHR